jgi:hypothetical protein
VKLPFEFGVKLILRFVIPGFTFALGLLPIMMASLAWIGAADKAEYVFVILIFLGGWLISISDMHIYMLFEGRRYWPDFLLGICYDREGLRLKKIQDTIEKYLQLERDLAPGPPPNADYQKYLENYVEQRNFFLNSNGRPEVQRPTRLGNLLMAYEDYPYRAHKMDAVFYWPRIWLALDKDLREEIDNQQAAADSGVYTSFALYFSALIWFCYAIVSSIQSVIITWVPGLRLPPMKVTLFEYLPSWWISWAIFLVFLISAYLTYRVSIHIQASYGEIFKAIFDNHGKNVDVRPVIRNLADLVKDPSLLYLNRPEQLEIARNYLDYNLAPCVKCGQSIPLAEITTHQCAGKTSQAEVENE